MSNMMPGDNSGAEWDEHDDDCRTLCPNVDAVNAITIETQTWKDSRYDEVETRYLVKNGDEVYHAWYRLENAEIHAERLRWEACMDHDGDHECNCADLRLNAMESMIEAEAERYADWEGL